MVGMIMLKMGIGDVGCEDIQKIGVAQDWIVGNYLCIWW